MSNKVKKLVKETVNISVKYGFDVTVESVMERWSEPHRHWHTPTHLYEMIEGVKDLFKENKIDEKEYHILIIAALFHDIVYNPKRNDNEEKSVEYMMSLQPPCLDEDIADEKAKIIEKICDIIFNTKTHDSKDGLCKKFNKLDTCILDAPFIEMLDWENKIYKEFRWAGWKQYKKGRIKFLLSSIKSHTHNVLNIKNLIDYVEKKVPKTGIIYYEIDKLPPINEFNEKNNIFEKMFDDVIIVIVYIYVKNYDKEKIKEYAMCSTNDKLYVLDEKSVVPFIIRRNGTVVKELGYMNDYIPEVDKDLNSKMLDFKTIYV